MFRVLRLWSAALVLAFFALTSVMHADSIDQVSMTLGPTDTNGVCTGSSSGASCAGYEFISTWDPDLNLLTFEVLKTAFATQDAYFQGFSLSMFAPNGSTLAATLDSAPSSFTLSANKKINNGGDNCQGSHTGTVCVAQTGGAGPLITTAGLTFDMTITGWNADDLLTSWDLLATGTKCASGSGPRCGNVFALTNIGATTGSLPPSVSEPPSGLLFGCSLLAMACLLRRKAALHRGSLSARQIAQF